MRAPTPSARRARGFGLPDVAASNAPAESLPGAPGMVVRAEAGERVLQSMVWGFPLRLKTMKPGSKPKPVVNIADLAKPMWKGLAAKPASRCLISLSAFAEPAGPAGAKTRTWITIKGQPLIAWGGLWRDSAEWGPVYSGAMTDANSAMAPVHDRMPVLLLPDEHERWLHGSFDELVQFQQRRFPDELIEITPTTDRWVQRVMAAGMASN